MSRQIIAMNGANMTQGCAIQWVVDSNVILNARAYFTLRLETHSRCQVQMHLRYLMAFE